VIAVLLALGSFVSTMLGGLVALRRADRLTTFMGLGAGMLIGAALFDLLPEGLDLARSRGLPAISVTSVTGLGFVSVYLLEKYLAYHSHPDPAYAGSAHRHVGDIGALSMTLHSFLDGTAIGIGFEVAPAVGALVAAAVICHDFSDGLSTSVLLFKSEAPRRRTTAWLIADASAPALGALATQLVAIPPEALSRLLAFFAGLFLYLGASHLLPEAHRPRTTRGVLLATLGGFAFLFFVTLALR
jgi:zinc transporter ZupT